MNSDVDDYTKTLHHRKIVRKTEKNNLLKTKTLQNWNISQVEAQFLHLACQVLRFAPLAPSQLYHCISHVIKLRDVFAGLRSQR